MRSAAPPWYPATSDRWCRRRRIAPARGWQWRVTSPESCAWPAVPGVGSAVIPAAGHPGGMHKTTGLRDPAVAFRCPRLRDDTQDRREANRAVAVSALGLAATGIIELLIAFVTGSVGLLGDAIHNLSESHQHRGVPRVPAVQAAAHRALPLRPGTGRGPGRDGIAVVIWASAVFAGYESIRKLIEHGPQPIWPGYRRGRGRHHRQPARGPVQAGRQAHRIGHAIADARHSWLDALSSAGALVGLIAVALGQPWATRWPDSPSPRSSATSDMRSPATSSAASPTASTRSHPHRRSSGRVGSRCRARPRPSPVDRPDATSRDRRLGGP